MPTGEPGFEWKLSPDEPWNPTFIRTCATNPNLWLIATSSLQRWLHKCPAELFQQELARFTRGQRMLICTAEVENHVNQGGFEKLWCYSGWALAGAIAGFKLIGAEAVARVLEAALSSVDWPRWGEDAVVFTPQQHECLAALDRRYCELTNGQQEDRQTRVFSVGSLKNSYLLANPGEFPELS